MNGARQENSNFEPKRLGPPDRRGTLRGNPPCIYCGRNPDCNRFSEAHVFPLALGGRLILANAVCGCCNRRIGREVETPAREILRFFRNIWGIRGRSRSLPTVKGTLRVVGRGIKLVAYFNEKGEPKTVVPLFRKDENGNDTVTLIGRWREVERQRRVMAERHPEYQWHEMYREGLGAAEVKVDRLPAGDLTDPAIRRLAAKIAYERFAQLRATNVLCSADFEPLRDLVMRGQEGGQPICGLLYHPTIMEKFLPIPVPMHAVGLVAHRRSRVLGAFVVLFGLYYYWVILSRNYQILGPWDDQVLIHPQTGEVDVRMLRGTARVPPVDWNQLIGLMTSSGRIVRDAEAHAVRKLTEAAAQYLSGS